jgi:hypothetical protein
MRAPVCSRVLLVAALLLSPLAQASEKVILSPGVLFSVSKRPARTALGPGAEVSAWTYPDSEGRSAGGFVQWQSMEFDHQRFCAGLQGFHAAPYLSIAVFSVALRVEVPFKRGDEALPSHGYDVGLAFGLKYPIGLLR